MLFPPGHFLGANMSLSGVIVDVATLTRGFVQAPPRVWWKQTSLNYTTFSHLVHQRVNRSVGRILEICAALPARQERERLHATVVLVKL